MKVLFHNEHGARQCETIAWEEQGGVVTGKRNLVLEADIIGRAETYAEMVTIARNHIEDGCAKCEAADRDFTRPLDVDVTITQVKP